MKIFDGHIHARRGEADPEGMIHNMDKAGIYGGCVFSNQPARYGENGSTFEERMEQLNAWTKGCEDRLFPVLWIHPYEEDIIEHIHEAVDRGVCAFKIICNDFYICDEQPMAVLREIAGTGKPVFFHSGILWDSSVSSQYNRPLNWEALMGIEGLRFSMGHCSWPWTDECIALYGEFLNALTTRNAAEMFFDITPGTPEVYREELLRRLYNCGYDVGDNVFFGSDASADDYKSQWPKKWLEIDGKIMDRLGVSKANRQKLYHHNLLRFLGKTQVAVNQVPPVPDNAGGWVCTNEQVPEIIGSWYKELKFPGIYDGDFHDALKNIKISDAITAQNYNIFEQDGRRNLLSFLYLCENLEQYYQEKGIDRQILLDTLHDLVIWTNIWTDLTGRLCLRELGWLQMHMSGKLFRLGRLQFALGEAHYAVPERGLKKGDNVIEVHIPEVGPLDREACEQSLAMAREFFAKHFPEFEYQYFTCHSWLLDTSLEELLSENSNILKFQDMFEIVEQDVSDDILKYVFTWNTVRDTVRHKVAASGFAERVKKAALSGFEFHAGYGIIKKA